MQINTMLCNRKEAEWGTYNPYEYSYKCYQPTPRDMPREQQKETLYNDANCLQLCLHVMFAYTNWWITIFVAPSIGNLWWCHQMKGINVTDCSMAAAAAARMKNAALFDFRPLWKFASQNFWFFPYYNTAMFLNRPNHISRYAGTPAVARPT